MAMDSESFQAVTVKKEVPDEVKESGGDKLVQQMQQQVVVSGLQQAQTKRPVCWSLYKYFKPVQSEPSDASLVVQQSRPSEYW